MEFSSLADLLADPQIGPWAGMALYGIFFAAIGVGVGRLVAKKTSQDDKAMSQLMGIVGLLVGVMLSFVWPFQTFAPRFGYWFFIVLSLVVGIGSFHISKSILPENAKKFAVIIGLVVGGSLYANINSAANQITGMSSSGGWIEGLSTLLIVAVFFFMFADMAMKFSSDAGFGDPNGNFIQRAVSRFGGEPTQPRQAAPDSSQSRQSTQPGQPTQPKSGKPTSSRAEKLANDAMKAIDKTRKSKLVVP